MKRCQVKITVKAQLDMEEIYNYIAYSLYEPQTAIKQYNRIADAILSLETMPERCRVLESHWGNKLKVRRMLVDNYSIFYRVENDVIVLRVLYSASNINEDSMNEI